MVITLIRAVLLYGLLIFSVRMMGKRQVAEMEPAEFVVTMLLANLASVPMQDNGLPLVTGLVPIFAVLALELILAVLSLKSISLRKLLCGVPTMLIREGEIDQKALAVSRVSLDELTQKLREKDFFDLSAVKYAILETDGELSVLPWEKEQGVTRKDLSLKPAPAALPCILISDGVVMKDNLHAVGFDGQRLRKELQDRGLRIKDVFLMTADDSGTIKVIQREKK